jgi:invasion protein IalB
MAPTTTTLQRGLAACLIATLATLGPCLAQTGKPAPALKPAAAPAAASAPVSAEPQSTSATFGDWSLNCVHKAGPGDQQVCEVIQSIVVKGQTGPIAQLAIGRTTPGDPLRLTLLLPPNVTLDKRPLVLTADGKTTLVELNWRRCVQGGCMSDAVLTDPDLSRLRGQETAGQIIFKDAADRELKIPMSWRGLPQALDAMLRG